MGLRDRWNAVRAVAGYAAATSEHWAVVTHVGRRVGPVTGLELEIHDGVHPPFRVSTTSWIPAHVRPVVGRHVAFHIPPSDDHHTHYAVDWDEPPRYGTPAERRSAGEGVVEQLRRPGEDPATAAQRDRHLREILGRVGRARPPH
jgi:hypothetical protein